PETANVGQPGVEWDSGAGEEPEPRSANASRVAAAAARQSARAEAEGQGGHDRRGATAAGMEGAGIDAVLRSGSGSSGAGDYGHAVAVPNQAAVVALHRAGCGDALECRSGVRRWAGEAPAASTVDPRAQPQSQPGAQGG